MARELPSANLPIGDFHLRYLLSRNERLFFESLVKAIGMRYVVFPKVRLCDIVRNTHSQDFNRISSKHVDFLVCYADSLKPCKAVELDDWTHTAPVNHAHDMVKEFYLNKAGIPVLRYKQYQAYYVDPLREAFKKIKADTDIPYPIFPVDVEVEEIYAYTDPEPPEIETGLESEILTTQPAALKIEIQSHSKPMSVSRKKQKAKKPGIMARLVFLFSGELHDE